MNEETDTFRRRHRWARFRGCGWCLNTRQIKTDERGFRECPFCTDATKTARS